MTHTVAVTRHAPQPSAPIAWDAREGHEYRDILYHQAEGIAKLTINRPEFCISALQSAMRGHGRPESSTAIRAAQFTSQAFTAVLKAAGVRIGRDGKGNTSGRTRAWRGRPRPRGLPG